MLSTWLRPQLLRGWRPAVGVEVISCQYRRRLTMATVHQDIARVRHLGGDEPAVQITLVHNQQSKTFNRPAAAPLSQTLARIALSLGPKQNKKQRRKKKADQQTNARAEEENPAPAPAVLLGVDGAIDQATTNSAAWRSGCVLTLGPVRWRVEANLPAVLTLTVPGAERPMVGYPLRALATTEFANAAQWTWTRSGDTTVLGRASTYTPTEADLGCVLHCTCVAVAGSDSAQTAIAAQIVPPAVVTTSLAVDRCPGDAVGLGSIRLLREQAGWMGGRGPSSAGSSPPRFCIMSYNLLANVYANTDEARDTLFPYCDAPTLALSYRMQLALREILSARPAILCLQEVDRLVMEQWLRPALSANGYDLGHYAEKSTSSREGVATFVWQPQGPLGGKQEEDEGWVVESHEVIGLGGAAPGFTLSPLAPAGDAVSREIPWLESVAGRVLSTQAGRAGSEAAAALANLSTKAQLLRLRRRATGERVLVANTHLFYHPLCSHLRALQLERLLQVASDRLSSVTAEVQDRTAPAFVLCGDLNAQPASLAGTLLRDGHASAHHTDWQRYNAAFRWDPTAAEKDAMQATHLQQQADEAQARSSSACAASSPLSLPEAASAVGGLKQGAVDDECDQGGRGEAGVPFGVELQHAFAFDWTAHGFTTKTAGFVGRLDYILPAVSTTLDSTEDGGGRGPSRGLHIANVAVMPSGDEQLLLPSVANPSDHVSLLYEMGW